MSTFLQRFRSCFSKGDALESLELRRRLGAAGFTLTELMVVVTIMTLLTGVFLFQQRQFDSTTLLRSLAYSVALSIREAQTYGLSVRSFGGEFPAYGILFDISNNDEYVLFADTNGDGQYNGSGEIVDSYVLQGNYEISDICATNGPELCGIGWMTVTFKRPNPDACIATSDPGGNNVCNGSNTPLYSQGRVHIGVSGGATRSVTVTTSGQISVGAVGP